MVQNKIVLKMIHQFCLNYLISLPERNPHSAFDDRTFHRRAAVVGGNLLTGDGVAKGRQLVHVQQWTDAVPAHARRDAGLGRIDPVEDNVAAVGFLFDDVDGFRSDDKRLRNSVVL